MTKHTLFDAPSFIPCGYVEELSSMSIIRVACYPSAQEEKGRASHQFLDHPVYDALRKVTKRLNSND
jgi:hypothetical protein